LKAFERRALDAALAKTHLPTDDIETPDHLFWRFETADDMAIGNREGCKTSSIAYCGLLIDIVKMHFDGTFNNA